MTYTAVTKRDPDPWPLLLCLSLGTGRIWQAILPLEKQINIHIMVTDLSRNIYFNLLVFQNNILKHTNTIIKVQMQSFTPSPLPCSLHPYPIIHDP